MTATADLLAFAVADHRLPPSTRAATLRLLGDTLAVGAAGSTAPGATQVIEAAQGWGSSGRSRLLGHPGTLHAPSAAFVNGFNIHCLEWDAVHEGAVVHALSVVTAAVAAACHRRGGVDPEDALTAIAVGVDISAGLGIAATSSLSFFRPAIAGTVGAALAVARIDGIREVADVLGLAHAACAGTMQAHVEGSIALPLQVANAARAAVASVDLVAAGLSGPHDALEGPYGHFALFDRGDLAIYTRTLGTRWLIEEVSTKPWPCGRASHGVLGALAALRPEIRGRAVTRIEACVPSLVIRLVGRPWQAAMTPAYARLCLPVLAAQMLRDGCIDPRAFSNLPTPAPLVLIDDGNPDPNALSPQHVSVLLADGTRLERAVPATAGTPGADHDAAAKLALVRALAPAADARIFDDPLDWLTAA